MRKIQGVFCSTGAITHYPNFPGDGDIDFFRFFNMVKTLNYKGTLTLECASLSEEGMPDYNVINNSLDYIRENITL